VEEFSGVDDEYRAAREAVVVADRLQNMLSNDVTRLQTGEGVWAAILTRKGTLISDLVAYQLGDALLLEMEPEGLSPAMESLSRYLVSEDVTLSDVTGDDALFSSI
jgi:folate-binding Fe-S cluster repair protein YgfZ